MALLNAADAIYFGDRPVDRVYLGTRQVWPWTPELLFQNGEQGGFWDFTNPDGLFQDAAGSAPVENPGDPIGMATDLSGNGNHLLQATVPARPTFTPQGALHDGVDDFLMAANAEDWTFLHDGSGGTLALSMRVDSSGSAANKMAGTRINGVGVRAGYTSPAGSGGSAGADVYNGDTLFSSYGLALAGPFYAVLSSLSSNTLQAHIDGQPLPGADVTNLSESTPQFPLRTLTTVAGRTSDLRRMLAINRTLTESERALTNAWLMEGVA